MRLLFNFGLFAAVVAAPACSRGGEASSALDATSLASKQSIDWYFNCPGDNDPWPHPPSDDQHLRIDDGGPTAGFYRRDLFGTPVSVHGKLCAPPKVSRDIIFVIDVSGSMVDSDPQHASTVDPTKMTCGRLDALEALFAVLDPTTTFAVGTFDTLMEDKSTKFFTNKADLYADLEKSDTARKYVDIICGAFLGTNYDAGMQFATDLFKTARPTADLTLIFLSDGQPNAGDGLALSAALKNPGVLVGTVTKPVIIGSVMLGTEDPTQIKALASIDPVTGLPIYANASAPGDLTKIVTQMANNVNSARLVHGGDAGEAPAAVDILSVLDFTTYKFELPPFTLGIDRTQANYDLTVKYADFEGNLSTDAGSIKWLDD